MLKRQNKMKELVVTRCLQKLIENLNNKDIKRTSLKLLVGGNSVMFLS